MPRPSLFYKRATGKSKYIWNLAICRPDDYVHIVLPRYLIDAMLATNQPKFCDRVVYSIFQQRDWPPLRF